MPRAAAKLQRRARLAGCAPNGADAAIRWRAHGTKMTVRHLQGEPLETTLSWAESEVEGFMRS
jgi:hypothetical protein